MKTFGLKFVILTSFFALMTMSCNAQKKAAAPKLAEFPKDYVGEWSGVLQIYNGKGKVQEVPMQLIVQPLKDSVSTQYSWNIIYGDKGKDNRPYRLVPVDAEKGHWLIDENDGIRLDCFYLGGTLFSQFAVQGNLLTCMERVEGNTMYYEIVTAKTKILNTTGGTSADVPPVESYNTVATQRAVLTKKK